MIRRNSFLLGVLILVSTLSCGLVPDGSTVQAELATIDIAFRNHSKGQVRWSVEDANSDAIVFDNQVFQPGEVKRATISTGPSKRFGEVRYKEANSVVWIQDSLIENGGIVELRSSESALGEASQ